MSSFIVLKFENDKSKIEINDTSKDFLRKKSGVKIYP